MGRAGADHHSVGAVTQRLSDMHNPPRMHGPDDKCCNLSSHWLLAGGNIGEENKCKGNALVAAIRSHWANFLLPVLF